METSRDCLGLFSRTMLLLGTPLIVGAVSVSSPAIGQGQPMAAGPRRVPVAQSTGSWLDDGVCASGTCSVGGDWGHGCRSCVGYHPFVSRPWFRGEYLMWWTKSADTPPLATTSPRGTPYQEAGVLPDADVLAGGLPGGSCVRLGARFSLGWWLSPCHDWGLQTSYTFLRTGTVRDRFTSDDHPILARPFFNVGASGEDAVVLAFPDTQTGAFYSDLNHRLDSVDVLLRRAVSRRCDRQWDLLFGYRYARLAEQLAIGSSSAYLGTLIEVSDQFDASNEFHGADLGIATSTQYCDWSLEIMAKVALGGTRSEITVRGDTQVSVPPDPPDEEYSAGMLALDSNIGTRRRSSFTAIPELRVNVGWDLTCRLRATFGYSLFYWSRVARPGNQIDRNLDPVQFPPGVTAESPAPILALTDYWAQGLSFGLDYRF